MWLRPAVQFENLLIFFSAPIALVLVEDDFVLTGAGSGGGKSIMERSKISLMLRAATVISLSSPL